MQQRARAIFHHERALGMGASPGFSSHARDFRVPVSKTTCSFPEMLISLFYSRNKHGNSGVFLRLNQINIEIIYFSVMIAYTKRRCKSTVQKTIQRP